MEGNDAAWSRVSLHVSEDVVGSEPLAVVARNGIPHHDAVALAQATVLTEAHPSVRRSE